jgi:glycerol-3-phosphate acyltransferase PlsX
MTQFDTLGIDIMGGDAPPKKLLDQLIKDLPLNRGKSRYHFYLTKELLPDNLPPHIRCIPVSEVISMKDDPLSACKRKKNSSMVIGLKELKNGLTKAFISHGNTGALRILSSSILNKLPKTLRPALLAAIPTKGVETVIVDVGASVLANTSHLLQFALFGIAYQKSCGINDPRVGLLNIGIENGKGRAEHKAFHKKVEQLKPFTFVGNIESQDIFEGKVDVVVTDGFSGNLFLKTAEASFNFIETTPFTPSGAILAGINGLVIKCHGNSSSKNFLLAADQAFSLIEKEFLHKLKQAL